VTRASDLHHPLYLPQLLANALNQDPGRPLLQTLEGETLSVGQFRDITSQFVQAFIQLGIEKGAKVAVISSNRPEVLHVTYGAQLTEAITLALHPMGSLDDHRFAIEDAGVDALVFDPGRFTQRAVELARLLPTLKLLSMGPGEHGLDLLALAASMVPAILKAPRVDGDGVSRLSYSGGTTGKPKGVAGTHRVGLSMLSIMMSEWEWPTPLRVLSCAPLSHAGGAMFPPTLLKNGTFLVLPGFEPAAVMQAIQDHRINCVMLVPTMIYAILDHPRFDEFDLSSLETVFYGASLMSPVRLKEAIERIGPVFFQFYGQVEAPMTVTVLRRAEHDTSDLQRLASCGRPVPWLDVELLDSENTPVPDGEPGEICVRGPLVMEGYRNNPELNAVTLAGGWLHTGDVAVRDAGGFLRIVDRKKDMIVTGGFNVFPREVEDVLSGHPAVAQVAVIGVPDPKWGEAVKAVVVLRPGATGDAAELIALVAAKKGSFQAPKSIDFIEALPLTPVGKPDKKALRALYLAASPVPA